MQEDKTNLIKVVGGIIYKSYESLSLFWIINCTTNPRVTEMMDLLLPPSGFFIDLAKWEDFLRDFWATDNLKFWLKKLRKSE